MDVPYSIEIKKEKDVNLLLITGDLIINYITKIKKSITEVIDENNGLKMKITNPSSMDITFIQLVSSLKETFENKNLKFSVEGTFNEDIYSLILNAGCNNLFKL